MILSPVFIIYNFQSIQCSWNVFLCQITCCLVSVSTKKIYTIIPLKTVIFEQGGILKYSRADILICFSPSLLFFLYWFPGPSHHYSDLFPALSHVCKELSGKLPVTETFKRLPCPRKWARSPPGTENAVVTDVSLHPSELALCTFLQGRTQGRRQEENSSQTWGQAQTRWINRLSYCQKIFWSSHYCQRKNTKGSGEARKRERNKRQWTDNIFL